MGVIIEVQDLVKKFGNFSAVDHISFRVQSGIIFGFLGPNGAGKTTTLKMLTTILKPTEGIIRIDGKDPVSEMSEVRKLFSIVFQDPSLDDELTVLENLKLHAVLYNISPKDQMVLIKKSLDYVDLWAQRNMYVKNFSGGMKRRLEISRAFLHTPKILFLDEPTIGLDPQTRNHIWNYIQFLSKEKGVTVFFITHYMEEAEQFADEVAIIDHGKILECDTPSKIKEKTKTKSLEAAFIKLTGSEVREEKSSHYSRLKDRGKITGRKWKQ